MVLSDLKKYVLNLKFSPIIIDESLNNDSVNNTIVVAPWYFSLTTASFVYTNKIFPEKSWVGVPSLRWYISNSLLLE